LTLIEQGQAGRQRRRQAVVVGKEVD